MKISYFTILNIYIYMQVCGVRIVNKPFEVEISDPREGPLLPLHRPARLFFER